MVLGLAEGEEAGSELAVLVLCPTFQARNVCNDLVRKTAVAELEVVIILMKEAYMGDFTARSYRFVFLTLI